MPNDSAATGRSGEEIATRYLERHGCTILARNWRANPGEVDIIADCPPASPDSPAQQELAFIEVRTRHGRSGLAEESISRRKAARMASAAYSYMSAHNIDPESVQWRIDLIAIAMTGSSISSISWIRGAIDEEMISSPG